MSHTFLTQAQVQKQYQQEQQMFSKMFDFDTKYSIDKQFDPASAAGMGDAIFKGRSYSSLTKDEKKQAEKHYKAQKARNTFVTAADMDSAYMQHVMEKKVTIGSNEMTQKDLFDQVRGGDCSHMQQLDSVLRNRAATEYMTLRKDELAGTAEDVVRRLKDKADPISEMMNPLLRMGISCVINSPEAEPETKAKFRRLDELLNQEIMIATITRQEGEKVTDSTFSQGDWDRNFESQKFMFKTMLTCHLGKLRKKDSHTNPPTTEPWQGSVANAFAHCSRVMITLPADSVGMYNEQRQQRMFDQFQGKAGFLKRGGATHTMSRKKKGKPGEAKEIKFFSPRSQYGMNVAVGGLGNNGIPTGTYGARTQRMLRNDGSCGHLFMHFEKGTKEKHAGMLLGFESDAYGIMNQTGHVHDTKATGEFASSFGGQRCDEIGDKYGGRTVDLSDCNMGAFTEILRVADLAMDKFRKSHGEVSSITLEEMTREVCGEMMDQKDLATFLAKLYRVAGEEPTVLPGTRIEQLYKAGK
ncbi:MAG: hypothetical protein K6A92_03830 [Lachnospiraceae bacterium]|nr:hypothetical protein [Lachnospiraceae bacterium]